MRTSIGEIGVRGCCRKNVNEREVRLRPADGPQESTGQGEESGKAQVQLGLVDCVGVYDRQRGFIDGGGNRFCHSKTTSEDKSLISKELEEGEKKIFLFGPTFQHLSQNTNNNKKERKHKIEINKLNKMTSPCLETTFVVAWGR